MSDILYRYMIDTGAFQPSSATDSGGRFDAVFRSLAQRNRRQLLGTLYEQSRNPVRADRLAETLDRSTSETPRAREEASNAEIALHHSHLPQLEEAGLVSSEDADGIELTNHPALQDTGIVDVITGEADATADSLDALFEALAHSRRRSMLDVLSHQLHPIHVETLAREVGAREIGVAEQDVPTEQVHPIMVSFRHSHLPKLEEADLISYDRDNNTVTYEGHPDLRVPWIHSVFEPDFRASATDESSPREIGTIEGRERVVSYGQSLLDRTDEELFCMITDTGLLKAGCLSQLKHASQRGVTVYLGIRDPTARAYIRENIPEVNLWEPKTDWLTLPVEGNTVGRLVLSDHNAVMLGTLSESSEDDCVEEKAIIGTGADNALVVMIRQMIQPHLEQIDEESVGDQSKLPF